MKNLCQVDLFIIKNLVFRREKSRISDNTQINLCIQFMILQQRNNVLLDSIVNFFLVGKHNRFEVRISLLWVKLWLTNKVSSRVIAFSFEILARNSDHLLRKFIKDVWFDFLTKNNKYVRWILRKILQIRSRGSINVSKFNERKYMFKQLWSFA